MSVKGSFSDDTKLKIGDTFEFNYGKYKVIDILNEKYKNGARKFKAQFINTGYEVTSTAWNIQTGRIRDHFYKSVANTGYLGNISHKHFLYNRWRSMISRCYSENDKDYMRYGAKGIYVSDDWHCFENYVNDVVKLEGYDEEKVKNKELNLDKDILSDLDNRFYSKNTCKWVTTYENNKEYFNRINKYFEGTRIKDGYKDISNSPIDFARKYGLNNDLVSNCLRGKGKTHKGWKFSYIEDISLIDNKLKIFNRL